jgi:hypothetical protein
VRRWWFARLAAAAGLAAAVFQGPARRVSYRVRLLERRGVETAVLATGAVSGPPETQLRLELRSDTVEFAALLGVAPPPEPDSATLAADVFTRRLAGRSRRGLPIWEEDDYRRAVRLAWSDTARLYPGGPPKRRPPGQWIEVVVDAAPVGGATRPTEDVAVAVDAPEFSLEAVARPRRVTVVVLLVRGEAVTAPSTFDLVPDAAARRVRLGGRRRGGGGGGGTALDVSLARPEPPRSLQDRVLARDADVVCLRVAAAAAGEGAPTGVLCGRLNNVARRLPLASGDTLVATFLWPGAR